VQITFNMNPGKLKSLCAGVILINPIAKVAITMEPIALGVRHAAAEALKVQETYWFRCAKCKAPLHRTSLFEFNCPIREHKWNK
jgi:hypothetical protein